MRCMASRLAKPRLWRYAPSEAPFHGLEWHASVMGRYSVPLFYFEFWWVQFGLKTFE